MQRQPDCDTKQVVTATGYIALRIRGTTRAEEDSTLAQSVVLMASVPGLPLPLTLARFSFQAGLGCWPIRKLAWSPTFDRLVETRLLALLGRRVLADTDESGDCSRLPLGGSQQNL